MDPFYLALAKSVYTSNNCKLKECVRCEGGGWWVVSGSGKGVQNLMGLEYREIKIKHFFQYEYQQLVPISFFLKNAKAYCTFYIYLAKPLSQVRVSKNKSNTDYDPQDILLQYRMINKTG